MPCEPYDNRTCGAWCSAGGAPNCQEYWCTIGDYNCPPPGADGPCHIHVVGATCADLNCWQHWGPMGCCLIQQRPDGSFVAGCYPTWWQYACDPQCFNNTGRARLISDCSECTVDNFGACCKGGCHAMFRDECEDIGGEFHQGEICTPESPCPKHPCCWPERPYQCVMLYPDVCEELGGALVGPDFHECTPDLCTTACCLPNGTCANSLATWCKQQGGTVMWGESCTADLCDIPSACCLCRGQCVDTSEGACDSMGGEWTRGVVCENQQPQCDPMRKVPCRAARFSVGIDPNGDPELYVPISEGEMNPHEYERGVGVTNCRTWRGNISATEGAWTCGQWDRDKPETKTYIRLPVMIDATGMAHFWTTYRPTCPEYAVEN